MQPEWLHMRDRGRKASFSKQGSAEGRCPADMNVLYLDANRHKLGLSQHAKSKRCLQTDSGALRDVTREDLAKVLVECLRHPPKSARVFSVQNSQTEAPSEDLASQFSSLREAVPV